MALEPALPFEFVVMGIAVSLQGSSKSREAWKETIRHSARAALPQDFWAHTRPLAVTIYLFPKGPIQGDIDNRIKPILDAMARLIYIDDVLVNRIVIQKFEPHDIIGFTTSSPILLSALASESPNVYIRLSDDLYGDLRE